MSDLISRQEVKEILRTEWIKLFPVELDPYLSLALEKIENIPSAESKKGKWIKENVVFTSNPLQYRWRCSECGTLVYGFSSGILTPYCHNCGAKMEVRE